MVAVAVAVVRRVHLFAAPLGVATLALAGCVLLALVPPAGSDLEADLYPTCPFRALTGQFCPGCGTLRGLHALLGGRLGAAIGYNALMVAVLPFLLFRYARWSAVTLAVAKPSSRQARAWPGWALFAVVIGFWVVRNLPGSALAP